MKYYVVDAFTDHLFQGNPAGVCILDMPLDDYVMQQIAAENNLPETAFVLRGSPDYSLRWFTPEVEIDLCGHATLASAFIIHNFVDPSAEQITFSTKSGRLAVRRLDDLYELDFPSRPAQQIEILPSHRQAIGCDVLEAHRSRDLLLLVRDETAVQDLQPDFELMKQFKEFGVIVTAQSAGVDFVSRFFAPGAGITEDPATGSSHCTLIPFWSRRLAKDCMTARQLSRRGGAFICADRGERVGIAGRAVLYLSGEIALPI